MSAKEYRSLVRVVAAIEAVQTDLPVIHRDKAIRLERLRVLHDQAAKLGPVAPCKYPAPADYEERWTWQRSRWSRRLVAA